MPKLFDPKDQHAPKRLAEKTPMKKPLKATVIIIAAFILLSCGGSVWALYSYDRVYPGICAGTVNVSGMDRKTLLLRLNDENYKLYQQKTVKLTVQNKEYRITTEEIGAEIDVDKVADKIFAYGRTGNYFKRVSDILSAAVKGASVELLTFNDQALRAKSKAIANEFTEKTKASNYEIKESKLILYLANKNAALNPETVYNALLERLKKADFSELAIEPEYNQVVEPDLKKLYAEIETEPQNARLDLKKDPKGETVIPHANGVKIDHEEAERLLKNRGNATEVEIPVEITEAEITTEELKKGLFRDVLSDVTTSLNPGLTSRTGNVKLAADYINDKILNPGDEFSFNGAVGARTEERGFKSAKVFEQGEIVDGIGGGICQVSSTIYMAALRADLKITERRNHQFTVTYAPLGQDATVVYGSTDFRFVNNTLYPLRVLAYQKGSGITVKLYGTKTENKEVKLVTTVLDKTPYESRTIVDPSLKPGETVVDSEGHTGYKTVTYRIVYIGGKEVRRDLENKSTYIKLDYVTRIGQAEQLSAGGMPGGTGAGTTTNNTAPIEADPVLGPDSTAPGGAGQKDSDGKTGT